jgi:hypothetical protein
MPLKGARYGRVQMLTDVAKERLIDGMQFFDGADDKSDVVRLDFVAPNCIPLIISSKKVIPSDSLGLHTITLSKESLASIVDMVNLSNAKINNRRVDYILLRVTYRHDGDIFQYYVTNETIVAAYLASIEKRFEQAENNEALKSFYEFIQPAELQLFNNN